MATTFEAVSVSEWKPSESTETAPLLNPRAIFAAATTKYRKRTR
jgi:hypothetical protein